MSTPEWKAYLDETVFIKAFGRISLMASFDRALMLDQIDHWDWRVVDRGDNMPRGILEGICLTKEEAMLAAENAAKELAQALMPLLEEVG